MVVDRQIPSRIGNKPLEDQGSVVTLPSTQELIGGDGKDRQYLSSQVSLFLEIFEKKIKFSVTIRNLAIACDPGYLFKVTGRAVRKSYTKINVL